MSKSTDPYVVRVLDLKPNASQANKPAELISITGHHSLSLQARRAITLLWHNAHRQGIEEGKDYTIEIDDLKTDRHKGYATVEDAIISLMQTILTVRHSDGSVERVQFLGGNDMTSSDRQAGVLTYSFDKRLVRILSNSLIWGKISLPVLMAFSSKYAISLYEHVAQWAGLAHKNSTRMTLEEFRDLVGVSQDEYQVFGSFNRRVIKQALLEINGLAPFNVSLLPIKTGKKVTHIRIGWWNKTEQESREAWSELQKNSIGRHARLQNQDDFVIEPYPSENRLARRGRLQDD